MYRRCMVVVSLCVFAGLGSAQVHMEEISYAGWEGCVKLSNPHVELVATTVVGPRIIRLAQPDGENILKEYPDLVGLTGGDEWRIYGGHRFWHAPEAKPRTYAPDNDPISYAWQDGQLTLNQPTEPSTGIAKEITITLAPDSPEIKLVHTLTNHNLWPVQLAPWCLTVMTTGGTCIVPQEPYIPHTEKLLPARPMVLWNYTRMADPRFTWGDEYILLKQDPDADSPQKIGVQNTLGWAAYHRDRDLFIKRFPFDPEVQYPDRGCNFETFTNEDMLEVESLGPLQILAPEQSVTQIEHWYLFDSGLDSTVELLETRLEELLTQTKQPTATTN